MRKDPLISVIIPLYNAALYIEEAISSVLEQTFQNSEIIVVDDGSTDEGPSIVRELALKDKRIHIHCQENKGACAARNHGFENSNGAYIQYLDADDVLERNKLACQVEIAKANPNCIVNARWGRFYSTPEEVVYWGPDERLKQDLAPVDWLIQNRMSTVHAWLTPRKLIEKAGLWREDLKVNQDGEFFLRVLLQSEKVLFCPEARVYYRSGLPGSISAGIQKTEAIVSRFSVIEALEKELLKREKSERVYKALADAYQEFVYSYYPKQEKFVQLAEEKVRGFGGHSLAIPGGKLYRTLSKFLGWKRVSRLKSSLGRM